MTPLPQSTHELMGGEGEFVAQQTTEEHQICSFNQFVLLICVFLVLHWVSVMSASSFISRGC